jgi:RimJ/RimL family protein N-acetyltransferase
MVREALTIRSRPLSGEDLPRLWEIMHEFPECNFDDAGRRSFAEFEQSIADRIGREILVSFDVSGELAGAFAFQPFDERSGVLRGVCFARQVHGTGVPLEAMRGAIAALFADGIEKISAQMFADNERAWRFFQKLGASEEGLLRRQTRRAGELIDVRIIAFFKEP